MNSNFTSQTILPTSEEDYSAKLKRVYEVSHALATTKDISTLLEYILQAAIDMTNADGGTIYRASDDNQRLNFEILYNHSLGIHLGGTSSKKITFSPLPMYREDGLPNSSMVAAYCAVQKKLINIPDAYNAEGFDFSGTRKFDEMNGYHSQSFLTVPLVDHEGDLVGVMQLLNKNHEKKVIAFTQLDELLVTSLSSQAAVAIVRMLLIEQQQNLFESFIKLINNAIDEKSPHTAGHCQRVPPITMMIAKALNDIDHGVFSGFKLSDKDFYELEIAALLHDCGKITTPVHVVDKATKLEAIYDRINHINTRFQLLKMSAYCECLENKLNLRPSIVSQEENKVEEQYLKHLEQINRDHALINRCNTGGEKMDESDIAQLLNIRARYQITDHQGVEQQILTQDELDNLSIRYGTLTDKERKIINYHITSTINMLEELPWPKHLKNVPEYAGGHHERMDGKGYPRGIKAGDMSVQARSMAIADVFEALTAPDRPYKKGMMLSQAINIMGNMVKGGHLDPDIFQVFIEKKVYWEYAQAYLDKKQIDEVDERQIPGYQSYVDKVTP